MVEAINTDNQENNSESTCTEEVKTISRKQVERETKKLKNKTKQATTVICKAENKPYDQLFSTVPTGLMFVTHFGNGDEDDQELVLQYVRKTIGTDAVQQITIMPGMNYGHIALTSQDACQALIESLQEANATLVGKRVLAFFHTTL